MEIHLNQTEIDNVINLQNAYQRIQHDKSSCCIMEHANYNKLYDLSEFVKGSAAK